jgi:hypothetical protein
MHSLLLLSELDRAQKRKANLVNELTPRQSAIDHYILMEVLVEPFHNQKWRPVRVLSEVPKLHDIFVAEGLKRLDISLKRLILSTRVHTQLHALNCHKAMMQGIEGARDSCHST